MSVMLYVPCILRLLPAAELAAIWSCIVLPIIMSIMSRCVFPVKAIRGAQRMLACRISASAMHVTCKVTHAEVLEPMIDLWPETCT